MTCYFTTTISFNNILNGIAYVQSTFNNTIISIADTNGNVISWVNR